MLDRTFLCPVPVSRGVRQLELSGQSGVRDQADPSKWFALSSASVGTGYGSLAYVLAGSPRVERGQAVPQPTSTLWIFRSRCKASSARVALSPRSLGGGAANQWHERYKCPAPRQIILRVRAEFSSPTSPATRHGGLVSTAPLKSGRLAVTTRTGKPIAYADVFESGKARLFFAGNCLRA